MRQYTTLATFAATLLLGATGNASAGPDWAIIESGRAQKLEQIAQQGKTAPKGERITQMTLQNYGPRPKFVTHEILPITPPKVSQTLRID